MKYEKLSDFYLEQEVLPTHGGFSSKGELDAYESLRRHVFMNVLRLPPQLFAGARVLEVGPDSGQNAIVFARWGARMTLVEPNLKAHPCIRDYFSRFGLSERLDSLCGADVKSYAESASGQEPYDLIVAEGFIHSVRPESTWLDLFAKLLVPGGFALVSYTECFGGFLELLLRVLHHHYRRLTGVSTMEAARALYQAKWDSIGHTRPMESWVMDVIDNPYQRLGLFLEPSDFLDKAAASGLNHYTSWPPCDDGMRVGWHKKILSEGELRASRKEFLLHSRLSHVFGIRLFHPGFTSAMEARLWRLLELVDAMIDGVQAQAAHEASSILSDVAGWLRETVATPEDMEAALALTASLQEIFALLESGDPAALARFCASDPAYVAAWGAPCHLLVLTKGHARS